MMLYACSCEEQRWSTGHNQGSVCRPFVYLDVLGFWLELFQNRCEMQRILILLITNRWENGIFLFYLQSNQFKVWGTGLGRYDEFCVGHAGPEVPEGQPEGSVYCTPEIRVSADIDWIYPKVQEMFSIKKQFYKQTRK